MKICGVKPSSAVGWQNDEIQETLKNGDISAVRGLIRRYSKS
ncbi:hypothetical protein [Clostridioides difficile]|nr:hypothetical protein [Clostridioides difficile]CCL85932.1 hypothetical protein BN188_700011 [Clostridioides difficile T19]MCZ1023827.1 hypothetical protein [Clostridioides difficile]MDB9612519.1 hypothetical protein [Clostridioides difficile]MDC2873574.1 hypothetical protein [Clostridioides difficile]MDE3651487.1 hypothetical protein [Clostridioides difficile]